MGLPLNEAFNPPYLIFPTEVLSVEINSFRSPSNKKCYDKIYFGNKLCWSSYIDISF